MPSVPTSRATRVTSAANDASWSTIVLTVSFSSSTSPRTSTVIFLVRSPFATAVVTSAMLRTCVGSDAGDAFDASLAAEDPLGADLARHPRHFGRERAELVDHRVDGLLQLEHLAADVDGDLLRQIAVCDRGGDVGDVAHLRGQRRRELVHRVGEILPRARHALHVRLAAELALRADLAGAARDF